MPTSQKFKSLPPLALYVHIPWCVKKCPYCDFNSHESQKDLPIDAYVEALNADLYQDADFAQGRKLTSIFFGGGTPSLFPAAAIARVINQAEQLIGFEDHIEITLEANPGTAERGNFKALYSAGVNRLSIGVQSFNNKHLTQLGRIHNAHEAHLAFDLAQAAGFTNINLDLMHGLPKQSVRDALTDLEHAIALNPMHISWYQLTVEPNTVFYNNPPALPVDDTLFNIQSAGYALLTEMKYNQYEVSAFALAKQQSIHNLNYWQFGDYLAIGAGAHGKITWADKNKISRYQKTRLPRDYLNKAKSFTSGQNDIEVDALPVEFMMNGLRLIDGVDTDLYTARTGLDLALIEPALAQLKQKDLLRDYSTLLCTTQLGQRFLNEVLSHFM